MMYLSKLRMYGRHCARSRYLRDYHGEVYWVQRGDVELKKIKKSLGVEVASWFENNEFSRGFEEMWESMGG